MAQQTINIGASPNDGTGTPLRTAFQYTNSNFSELYTAVGPSGNNIVVPGNATISGDLTVDTSTLKVDSANNRVGIGTASPSVALDVVGAARFVAAAAGPKLSIENAGGSTRFKSTDTSSFYYSAYDHNFTNTDGSVNRYTIDNNGVSTWYVSGTTAMTLNSTGLGVGITPDAAKSTRLSVYQTGDLTDETAPLSVGNTAAGGMRLYAGVNNTNEYVYIGSVKSGTGYRSLILQPNGGNVGIGVTPSAWNSTFKALQMGIGGSAYSQTGFNSVYLASNTFVDSVGNTKYINTDKATYYRQYDGIHSWFNAVSGTAGNAFTATQAMTLDASGRLLVGKTSGVNSIETVGAGVDGRGTVTGVSTVATTIYTIKQSATAAMCVVFGDNGTDGFCDIVLFLATVAPKVVSSQTLYGSPAARTYSTSTTNLQLALASGTLSIRTAALSTLNT